ncbi:hypothetical protein GUJ93_ZPchr0002g24128 [Zizania palustris]|uniref:Uncharacterized protein n=1 Tax=Zizania palustris TaxID=103762 RepID=A0A8J5VUB8_ZIZPA|nr:hypothetical protein GUJ93_ZPchr0002g24128 [Zizania palustris]
MGVSAAPVKETSGRTSATALTLDRRTSEVPQRSSCHWFPARRPAGVHQRRAFTVFHDGKLFFRWSVQEHYFKSSTGRSSYESTAI